MDTNLLPPFFGPTHPIYPIQVQLLRVTSIVTGASLSNLYFGYTQQLRTDNLQPRDRESCLVLDVRRGGLSEGYHLGRLATSFDSLPVYEVADCCSARDNDITVVNDCTLTRSPGFSPGLVVNLCDNTLNFWTGIYWITWCPCAVGSGSSLILSSSGGGGGGSSGGPCVPGVCSYCNTPPSVWTVVVAGMTGDLAPLNGTWVLANLDNCRWAATKTVGGVHYYTSFVVGASVQVLGFLDLTHGTTLAVYSGPQVMAGECCNPVELTLSPGFGGGGGGLRCSNCDGPGGGGGTPISWTALWSASDWGGCYAALGPLLGFTAQQSGDPCFWFNGVQGAGVYGELRLSGTTLTAKLYSASGSSEVSGTATVLECCQSVVMNLSAVTCSGADGASPGTFPSQLTWVPSCSDGGNTAPSSLLAVPTCCPASSSSGSGGGGSSSSNGGGGITVPCCAGTVSSTLYATFTGAFSASDVVLTYNAGLNQWTGSVSTACGSLSLAFFCTLSGSPAWHMTITNAGSTLVTVFNCSPFEVISSNTFNAGPCVFQLIHWTVRDVP